MEETMKCVKRGTTIMRVRDNVAEKMVAEDDYQYCSKTEWKEQRTKEGQ